MKPDGDTVTVATRYEGAAPVNQLAHEVDRGTVTISASVCTMGTQQR